MAAGPSKCLLCDEQAQPNAYLRLHMIERKERRGARRYELDARLCQRHANMVVKRLKQVVPKRLFTVEAAT